MAPLLRPFYTRSNALVGKCHVPMSARGVPLQVPLHRTSLVPGLVPHHRHFIHRTRTRFQSGNTIEQVKLTDIM